jgi:ATP-dependent RNA helicase RhlE
LAAQIGENFAEYSHYMKHRHMVIFGGVNQNPQVRALRAGIDVLIATPGRLLDLVNQGHINLSKVDTFILDEADRMLDMGFIRDIRRVLDLLPKRRQNLLFSATMPKSIMSLANSILQDPIRVEVNPQSSAVERIEQWVYFVTKGNKKRLLPHLLEEKNVESCIVFTRTKHGANRVVRDLEKVGVEAAAIHGNKSQGARTRALDGFKKGTIRVLVATDIASRGIDVDGVSHVFNYDLPNIPESYVHRIGRTGRAGKAGCAIAFCDESEAPYLVDIEKTTGSRPERERDHQWHNAEAEPTSKTKIQPSNPGNGGRGRGGGGRSNQGRGGGANSNRQRSRRRGGRSDDRARADGGGAPKPSGNQQGGRGSAESGSNNEKPSRPTSPGNEAGVRERSKRRNRRPTGNRR